MFIWIGICRGRCVCFGAGTWWGWAGWRGDLKGAGFEGAEPAGASRDIVEVRGAVGVCLGPFATDCGAKAIEIKDLVGG